ncbi:hypothetical protein Pcinc_033754 [Petrolisthes cinctipes]|uniref:AAA+ ATPase domain-containing protein n=1 Tax=Petrolisthes cinctipes TaxID=88211 RepID=A0AAE1JY28_PETCI|nr:hypothetical protein Pcinc_033754 [Petrolisthes cinctipes]
MLYKSSSTVSCPLPSLAGSVTGVGPMENSRSLNTSQHQHIHTTTQTPPNVTTAMLNTSCHVSQMTTEKDTIHTNGTTVYNMENNCLHTSNHQHIHSSTQTHSRGDNSYGNKQNNYGQDITPFRREKYREDYQCIQIKEKINNADLDQECPVSQNQIKGELGAGLQDIQESIGESSVNSSPQSTIINQQCKLETDDGLPTEMTHKQLSGYSTRSLKKKIHDDSVGKLPSGNITDMKLNRTSDGSDSVDTDKYRMVVDVTSTSDHGTTQITKEKDTIHPNGTNVSQITKEKDTIHPIGTSITCPVSQQSETNHIKEDGLTLHTMSNNSHICDLSSSLLQPIEEGEICGMTRKYYGTKSVQKEKVIILLGAAGCGKTTLVNFIANYFQGNKKANGELIHVARCCNNIESITKIITAYTFCNDKEHTPITIIDTPGLNDSSGAEIRDHVLSLKTFLANIVSHNIEIHTIGFVAQAHLVRLTSSERLVMDYISTVFGETCGDHIITFVTFSDNQENPPIVEAMNNYGVNCKLFLKFNNSVLTIKKGDDVDELDRAYWRIGHKSWKKCMKALEEQLPLSIHTMETLQNNVYVSQVFESVERDLKSELKVFITYTENSQLMKPEAIKVCESVWKLVTIVSHFSSNHSSNTHLVDTLIHYAEEVCYDVGANENKCIIMLSLAPSRELVKTGIAILKSMAPVYTKSLEVNKNRVQKNGIFLYCYNCGQDHRVQRIQSKKKLALITYRYRFSSRRLTQGPHSPRQSSRFSLSLTGWLWLGEEVVYPSSLLTRYFQTCQSSWCTTIPVCLDFIDQYHKLERSPVYHSLRTPLEPH